MMSAPKLPAATASQTRTAPGAAVPGGFKGSNASFETAAASYLVYPTEGLPANLPGKLTKPTKPVGHLNGSPCSVWRTAPSI